MIVVCASTRRVNAMLSDLSPEFKVALGGAFIGFLMAMYAYVGGQRLAAEVGAHIPGGKMERF